MRETRYKFHAWSRPQQKYIWDRDGGICAYCGNYSSVIDHVIPFDEGGPTKVNNGVCACRSCNYKKRGLLKQEYITRGILWLSMHGENTNWIDNFQPNHR